MPLPKILISRLQDILGENYSSVIASLSEERRGSFRINNLYPHSDEVFEEFEQKWIVIEPFVGLEWVYMFDRVHQYAIKGTRAFYDGKIYLQSIASMLPVLALDPKWGENILDICAAPGSKTTQIAMLMKNTGKIVALEQDRIRFEKMLHNIHLQWAKNIRWMKVDARKYLQDDVGNFDRILLDAPCSAEGRILVSNEKTYGFWSEKNIQNKATFQHEILSLAIDHLKMGGEIVYSTCTLAPEENEWVITRILADRDDIEILDIDIWLSDQSWWTSGSTSFGSHIFSENMNKTVRILPSSVTEWFFMAKIRKL
jgi:NOL1/NOP2/sun family putative RNA methylase